MKITIYGDGDVKWRMVGVALKTPLLPCQYYHQHLVLCDDMKVITAVSVLNQHYHLSSHQLCLHHFCCAIIMNSTKSILSNTMYLPTCHLQRTLNSISPSQLHTTLTRAVFKNPSIAPSDLQPLPPHLT